ncbi:lysophospholipid acyltransferase family protein [Flagellimonas meishanensis]|uniref:lysophospholipid acyltransferase family protein n=1 Tax=Flagellimonas meishanensis TaxID=2873264 RepID=UPI001CA5FFCB|nr:lysophospholipid acyltransferase family protein [[Muricauda] meishanensis]
MKQLGYYLIKLWASAGLFCYYKRIKVVGAAHVPTNKPVLFLSNHQNALLDVLLIATRCRRKPWFLARSDIFANPILQSGFSFLQMLPIYRLRDGRANLTKNGPIFELCASLLANGEAIVLFPEANHSLRRRVRPLSKGFTRVVLAALEKYPNLDLQLVAIGQNYAHPTQAGDSATLHFGKPISVQQHLGADNFVSELRQAVFDSLTGLTTHIPEDLYDDVTERIGENGNIYLDPAKVNTMVNDNAYLQSGNLKTQPTNWLLRRVFVLWNLPMVMLWRMFLKPRVPEEEFMATFRIGFALLIYPLFYLLGFLVLWNLDQAKTACLFVLGHAVVNMVLVKMGITSSSQRK